MAKTDVAEQLKELTQLLGEAEKEIQRLQTSGLSLGLVVDVLSLPIPGVGRMPKRVERWAQVLVNRSPQLTPIPPFVKNANELRQKLVVVNGSGAIVAIPNNLTPLAQGQRLPVKRVDGNTAEVSINGVPTVVHTTVPVAVDDEVLLHAEFNAITKNFGAPASTALADLEHVNVDWSEIGGQTEAKEELKSTLILPIKEKAIFARYGQKPHRGVLLHGLPGNGKTMLGKALATALAKEFGHAAAGFIYVKGPEILGSYVGETERLIRELFAQGREFERVHGYPMTIFLDEADALLFARGKGISSDVNRTIVTQFLTEMDGLDSTYQPVIVLATNRPEELDPAVVREGRMDVKIYVAPPDLPTAQQIFNLRTQHIPGATKEVQTASIAHLYDPKHVLAYVTYQKAGRKTFCLGDVVSGAMVVGLVRSACRFAIQGEVEKTSSGLQLEHVVAAVEQIKQGQRAVDISTHVLAHAKQRHDTVLYVERV